MGNDDEKLILEQHNAQENGDANENGDDSGDTYSDPSVDYINQTVLGVNSDPYLGMSNALVDQAAGMMVQDMRGFLQGSEQLLMAGYGKAVAYIVDPNTTVQGAEMSVALTAIMAELALYSAAIGKTASGLITDFKGA